jgi:hypothetical protein
MILTTNYLSKFLELQNLNLIIVGKYISFINDTIQLSSFKTVHTNSIDYRKRNHIYYVSIEPIKHKQGLIDLLKDICISSNYYTDNTCKKIIILIGFDTLKNIYQQSIKTIMDTYYISCVFILHINYHSKVYSPLQSRCLVMTLPYKHIVDHTLDISYKRILTLLKEPNLPILKIRELCYMYYMNHTNSISLQELCVEKIGSNNYIPNPVKCNVIKDICQLNTLYKHSYRKSIFLEYMILCLFKHLQHYTYNLE